MTDPSASPPRVDQVPARRVFVSYTAVDEPWAEWVAWQLEAAGHEVRVQTWDFQAGNFVEHVDAASGWAEVVLAVCSDAYCASPYARDEWTAALVRGRDEPDRLLLVRVEPCALPPLLATQIFTDLFAVDEDEAAQRLLRKVTGTRANRTSLRPSLVPHLSQADQTSRRFHGARPAISNLPGALPERQGTLIQNRTIPYYDGSLYPALVRTGQSLLAS